jgi:F-type H+-transporting ATPase subunit delta
MSGRNVQMALRVDPSIIGGVVARIGSTVYDASIATQLQKMKQRLVENV